MVQCYRGPVHKRDSVQTGAISGDNIEHCCINWFHLETREMAVAGAHRRWPNFHSQQHERRGGGHHECGLQCDGTGDNHPLDWSKFGLCGKAIDRRSIRCWHQPRHQGVDFAAAWDGAPVPIPCTHPRPCSTTTNERRKNGLHLTNTTWPQGLSSTSSNNKTKPLLDTSPLQPPYCIYSIY